MMQDFALDLSTAGKRTCNYPDNPVKATNDNETSQSQRKEEAKCDIIPGVYQAHDNIKVEEIGKIISEEENTSPYCKWPGLLDHDLRIQKLRNENIPMPFSGNACDEAPIYRTTNGITVNLHDHKLWRAFLQCGTEMIISRGGRRMFPHIILSFDGLSPEKWYALTLEIQAADDRRYRYIDNSWMVMGMADPSPAVQPITHSDSPNTGSYWTQNRASFSKVRLTNNKNASRNGPDGNILLLSMHKYVVVIKLKDETCPKSPQLEFRFDESTFFAVTAYQNYNITTLKIKNNPFAKAFRDTSSSSEHRYLEGRRKEIHSKYNTKEDLKRQKSSYLPYSMASVSPLYYPYPGLQKRHLGHNLSIDSFKAESILEDARMTFLSWMSNYEQIHNAWLKSTGHQFDINQFVPQTSLGKSENECFDDQDDLKDEKCAYIE